MRRAVFLSVIVSAFIWSALLAWQMQRVDYNPFRDDAGDYSTAAIHFMQDGHYSLDGVTPYMHREPGYSVWLAGIYRVFGVQSWVAVVFFQWVLHMVASLLFCRSVRREVGDTAAFICLGFLTLLPSIWHIIFSVLRESLTLSLGLLFMTVLLELRRTKRWPLAVVLGALMGCLLLVYAPFMLLPFGLVALFVYDRIPLVHIGLFLVSMVVVLAPWFMRNMQLTGELCFAGCNRSAMQWAVRGEQAEQIRGMEPFWCLWAEYISRDWEGRSAACSFNGVKNGLWPDGFTGSEADGAMGEVGKQKIFAHPLAYAWFSVFEILEYHLPFVNGWGTWYNILAALGIVCVYAGFLFFWWVPWRRVYLYFGLCMAYSLGIFILTDATPRYHMPVIFCYILLAASGYAALLSRIWRPSHLSSRPTTKRTA